MSRSRVRRLIALGMLFWGPVLHADRNHVIRKGETLSHIATKYGVSRSAIIQANGIRNPNLIRMGKKLVIPEKGSSSITHIVRKGDSLGAIAMKYGTTVQKLVTANGLRNADSILIGQRLKIPFGGSSTPSKPREEILLPADLLKQLKSIRFTQGKWKGIVIHHSGTKMGSAKGMDRVHREERKMANGLAYHFVIGNGRGMKDGEVYIGNRWKKQPPRPRHLVLKP